MKESSVTPLRETQNLHICKVCVISVGYVIADLYGSHPFVLLLNKSHPFVLLLNNCGPRFILRCSFSAVYLRTVGVWQSHSISQFRCDSHIPSLSCGVTVTFHLSASRHRSNSTLNYIVTHSLQTEFKYENCTKEHRAAPSKIHKIVEEFHYNTRGPKFNARLHTHILKIILVLYLHIL
jgi:hypothetical protein